MSIQSARDFLSKVVKDEGFRKGLCDCKNKAGRMQYARRAGFEFTNDEIKTVRSELQDSDLDVISGGGCCPCEADVGCWDV